MKIPITVSRTEIFDEIAKTTGYTGAKLSDSDEKAYRRLSTTSADTVMLSRLWMESRDNLCMALRRLIDAEWLDGNTYYMELSLSEAFDTSLSDTLAQQIFCYFVNAMTAKWLHLANDAAAASEYTLAAASMLTDISRKALCKKAPKRPAY